MAPPEDTEPHVPRPTPPSANPPRYPASWGPPPPPPPPRWPAPRWPPPERGDGAGGSEGPPFTRRDGGAWVVFALLGFVVGQIAALILVAVTAAAVGRSADLAKIATLAAPPEWYVVSSLVGLWLGFFGAPWLASHRHGTRRLVADMGIRFQLIDVTGVLVGVGGQFLVTLLYLPFINHLHNFSEPTRRLTGSAHGLGFVVIGVFTVIGAPFMEELFFRGLLLRGLLRLLGQARAVTAANRVGAVATALVLDGVLFGLAHGEMLQFAGLALFGGILAFVSYRTGRQGMNMVAHASFNLVAVLSVALSRGTVH